MANTGWKNPSSVISSSGGAGQIPWVSPENAAAADDVGASATHEGDGDISEFLIAYEYNAGVPTGATIDGIEFRVRRQDTSFNLHTDNQVYVQTSGGFSGDNIATNSNWGNSWEDVYYGGATDKLNISPTPAMVNHSSFGLGVQVYMPVYGLDPQAEIDVIQLRVHYTESAAPQVSNWLLFFQCLIAFCLIALKLKRIILLKNRRFI